MYKMVKDEACVLPRKAEEEIYRWRGHFERALSHEELSNLREVESGNELNVKTAGRITQVEIKKEEKEGNSL